jgi:hypothetical protein
MFTQKQVLIKISVFLLTLCLISSFGLQVLAKEKIQDEQVGLSEMLCKGNTGGDSSSQLGYKKDSVGWMGRLFSPILKYTPQEMEVPYTVLPESFEAWKNFKKNMEEKYGTNISITLDDHHQQILNGPGARKGRNIFWWNLTLKQKLWEGGKLIFKARGSIPDNEPPNGITSLVGTKLNLDWAASETAAFYVANVYLEQKLLNDKLLIAAGKLNFPDYFDENKVAGWDFFSHSLAKNQAFPHRYHTIGALGRYDLSDQLYVQAGISDAQGIRSETGLKTAFYGEDYFITMGELGVKTKNDKGLEGNYRFDLWYDPQPLKRHLGGPQRDTIGYGISFDQMLSKEVGAFLRYGWDDGRVRKFSNYWSLGGTWTGPISTRSKDVLGFGFGQGITHHDYQEAQNATHTESIFETYYKIYITEWCSLTLDLQTLLNPGTNSHNDTAIIPGIRVKMVF